MEIRSTPVISENLKIDSAPARASAHEGTQAPRTQSADDSVNLTEGARQLQDVQTLVAGTPVVNSERVAALRAAIADGSYQIDPHRVADNFLRQEQAAQE